MNQEIWWEIDIAWTDGQAERKIAKTKAEFDKLIKYAKKFTAEKDLRAYRVTEITGNGTIEINKERVYT